MAISKNGPVTEVFITHVKPGHYEAYRDWASRVHAIEKTFPGYLKVDIQAPSVDERNTWMTILHFDTEEHLDNWLKSKERATIIKESDVFVEHLEEHRLKSAFPGWFSKDGQTTKSLTSIIKESMLVLLVLFPIVMLEMLYLNPHLKHWNLSPATFLGNTISVSLLTWPMMPICLYLLNWWLEEKTWSQKNILGFCFIFLLYALEILFFSLLI